MANIKLKSLIIEAEDFKARSKETGKLVHFKSKDSYQAALKAGTHEDPKDKKNGSSKASAKPNSMFGGDYAKDRGVETPKYDTSGETDYFEEYEQLPDNIKNLMDKHFGSGDDEYDYKELQSIQKDFEANGWTFDFDLGGTPFELKPLPQNKQKSKEAPKESPKINSKNWKPDEDGSMSDEAADDVQNYLNNVLGADGLAEVDYNTGNIQYGLADSENSIFVGYTDGTYNVSFEGPSMDLDKMNQSYKSFKNPKEALQYAGELAKLNLNGGEAPKADVKSIVKDLLKKGDKEFRGAYKLADVVDDFKDSLDDSDADGKELKARLDKGEGGIYVQTDETEGTVVFNDGSQYKFSHVEDGPIPVTKVGKEAPKADTPKASSDKGDSGFGWGPETDRKKATGLPKKASQLDYKHSNIVADTVNKAAGLDGYAQTDDNTGAIMFNASKGDMPTYTLYVGANDDYGKPDEFRVSLEPTYGNDPSGLQGKHDKSFKSAEEAMAFAVEIAKKYKKELQMDDDDTNESTKLMTMIKK